MQQNISIQDKSIIKIRDETNITLLDLMTEKGYTQASLSKALSRDPATLNRILHGVEKPNRKLAIQIAKLLHSDSRTIFNEGEVERR